MIRVEKIKLNSILREYRVQMENTQRDWWKDNFATQIILNELLAIG